MQTVSSSTWFYFWVFPCPLCIEICLHRELHLRHILFYENYWFWCVYKLNPKSCMLSHKFVHQTEPAFVDVPVCPGFNHVDFKCLTHTDTQSHKLVLSSPLSQNKPRSETLSHSGLGSQFGSHTVLHHPWQCLPVLSVLWVSRTLLRTVWQSGCSSICVGRSDTVDLFWHDLDIRAAARCVCGHGN